MEPYEEIDRLNARLQWERGGPLALVAGEATDALATRAKTLVGWVREAAGEQPLICLLCALQLGFVAARWMPRRAKH